MADKQIALRPQDIVVVLRLSLDDMPLITYAALAKELAMAASQVFASVKRAGLARLLSMSAGRGIEVNRAGLREFAIHGVRYAFPAISAGLTRGVPTAYAAPSLRSLITQPNEPPPVWPHPDGQVRGFALYPLAPAVPHLAQRNDRFYDLLSAIDAIRIGAAREREIASELLLRRLD
jgi:hypothetical protein